MVLLANSLRYQSRALEDISVNLPGHSDGRICMVPEAAGRVWEGGGIEEQGVPATEGGKQEAENNMEERSF